MTNWLHVFVYSKMAERRKSSVWKHFVIDTVDITSATFLHCQESISMQRRKTVNISNLHKRSASSQAGEMCIARKYKVSVWYLLFILRLTSVLKVSTKCGFGGTLASTSMSVLLLPARRLLLVAHLAVVASVVKQADVLDAPLLWQVVPTLIATLPHGYSQCSNLHAAVAWFTDYYGDSSGFIIRLPNSIDSAHHSSRSDSSIWCRYSFGYPIRLFLYNLRWSVSAEIVKEEPAACRYHCLCQHRCLCAMQQISQCSM